MCGDTVSVPVLVQAGRDGSVTLRAHSSLTFVCPGVVRSQSTQPLDSQERIGYNARARLIDNIPEDVTDAGYADEGQRLRKMSIPAVV